jgi:cytochrome oxidase Cu insertion factor (SCO1/SenC/PrrC family)
VNLKRRSSVKAELMRWLRDNGFGACLLLLSLAALSLAACSGTAPEAFQGTVFRPPRPAASFQLQNQFGQQVGLSDYRGKVVLLTFLYTSCTDICPIVTSQLREAQAMLGDAARDVAFVAVTVDPERDTVEAAYAYSEKWDMLRKWDFLVGAREQLSPIWKAYYLDPSAEDHSDHDATPIAQSSSQGGALGALKQGTVAIYNVSHSAPVYLIDRKGDMRVVFTPPLEPQAIAHDAKLLLD